MIDAFESHIYNNFLIAHRKHKNLPFKLRKDFNNIEEDKVFLLKKLSSFFKNYKNINYQEFFEAPYKVYGGEFYDLSYFISPKAIKAFTLYQKQKQQDDPDNIEILNYTLNSLKFIKNFCKENNISPIQYLNHKTGIVNTYLLHLKEHKINFYSLFGYTNFFNFFKKNNYEELKFLLGDVVDSVDILYHKYIKSSKNKALVENGIKKIVDYIK